MMMILQVNYYRSLGRIGLSLGLKCPPHQGKLVVQVEDVVGACDPSLELHLTLIRGSESTSAVLTPGKGEFNNCVSHYLAGNSDF